mgnify:FL=1
MKFRPLLSSVASDYFGVRRYHWGPGEFHDEQFGEVPIGEEIGAGAEVERLQKSNPGDHESSYHDHMESIGRTLAGKRLSSLAIYKSAAYRQINADLRRGRNPSPMHRDVVSDLDKVTSHVMQKPLTVYRGFDEAIQAKMRSLKPGHTFVDRAFVSTSHDPAIAHRFSEWSGSETIAKIYVPEGSRGYHLDRHDFGHQKKEESEFLLARGTKFRVVKHSKGIVRRGGEDHRVHVVHLEVVPPQK